MLGLWDHQARAAGMVRDAFAASPRKRVLLVIPTGGGKTRVAVSAVLAAVAGGWPVLWNAHRVELVEQAHARMIADGLPADLIGVITDGRPSTNPHAPVQVASVQTVARMAHPPTARLIIDDEAHHDAALTYRSIHAACPDAWVLGLTATPERGDGVGLGAVFDQIVAPTSIGELIERGHLVPTETYGPSEPTRELAMDPVAAYGKHCPGERMAAFFATVPEAMDYAARFTAAGSPAACVHGELAVVKRREILAQWRAGTIRIVTNVYVLVEGYDDPTLPNVMIARACTAGALQQMVGRGRRASPGKTHCKLIDLRGQVHVHGLPDDDVVYSLDGRAIRRGEALIALRTCEECGAIYKTQAICPRCGAVHEVEQRVQTVRPRDVDRVHRVLSSTEKSDLWRRIVLDAHARGYKPGFAFHKFRSIAKHDPLPGYGTFDAVVRAERVRAERARTASKGRAA